MSLIGIGQEQTESIAYARVGAYIGKVKLHVEVQTAVLEGFEMADARIVANRFLELAREQGRSLTPMQVLKLVYIAHGWMLGLNGRPLISQPVEAWRYGPVVRDVYNGVRSYGRSPVTAPMWAPQEALDYYENDIVSQVYRLYGNMDGISLSNITHMPDTPWAETYKPGEFGSIISNDLIGAHYQRLSRERRNTTAA